MGEFIEVAERFTDGSVWVIKVVVESAKFASIETNSMDAHLEETRDDGFDAVIDFGDGLIVSSAVDAGDAWTFVFTDSGKEILILLDGLFGFF